MTQLHPTANADLLATSGHYQKWVAAGEFIYTAGLVPRDAYRRLMGLSIEEQTVAVLRQLDDVLREAGTSRAHLVKLSVYLADLALIGAFNAAYASEMNEVRPARTTIGCNLNGVLIEIDAVAFQRGL
jgi:2-iminobutanoate/2-iminopropanoate deaminase